MVRSAALKLALLAALVLASHFVALEWLGRQADAISALPPMAPAMYTRMLRPAAPPPVVVAAKPVAAPVRPRIAPRPRPVPPEPAPVPVESEAAAAQPHPEPAAQPEPAPPAEAEAPAPEPDTSPAPAPGGEALASWPTDTRLTYALTGHWRGPLYGDARVQWQREGDKYQVRLDVRIQVFGTQVLTSQGEVTPDGLMPRAYEELRPGKRRFARFGDQVLLLENGRTAPRPSGMQDTASQFVELTHRFATGRETLEVGRSVSLWLARPNAVDEWTYDIVSRDLLRTAKLGVVEAWHLKPRPIANPRGNITAEMWFAPHLLHLPVRIKVLMGDEAWLDLVVEHIEQR